jgi:hypothetical protein
MGATDAIAAIAMMSTTNVHTGATARSTSDCSVHITCPDARISVAARRNTAEG